MRNLKKLLALVLALVMAMSLVAVANAADYKDVDANDDHIEAIDVMSGIGVIGGYPDGSFKPEGNLTRAEGAKIVAYMLLGDAVNDLPASTPFADVPAKHWASAPVAYLKAEGIVNGRNATTFDPDADLNGYEFAKMLLTALGYSSAQEGFTGASWSVNVAKLAAIAGINDNAAMNGKALARGDAAQMAFNTLKADVVEYPNNTSVTAGGITVSVSGKASKVAIDGETDNYAGDGGDGINYQQFCEKYFKDLKAPAADQTDDFGRPGSAWSYKGDALTFEADKATYSYVVGKAETVESFIKNTMKKASFKINDKAFGGSTNGENEAIVVVNGGSPASLSATTLKIGSTIELYMDESNTSNVTKIVVIEPVVATLTGDAATQEKDGKTQVKVPGVANMGSFSEDYTTENVTGYEGLKKDDVVLVVSADGDGDDVNTVIITKAASIDGKITGKKSDGKVVIGGTDYAASTLTGVTYSNSSPDYDNEYTFYLDASGSIVKAVKTTEKASEEVAYVLTSKWVQGDDLETGDVGQARMVFMDGTVKVVTVSKVGGADASGSNLGDTQLKNAFVTYTVDSDGNYEVTKKDAVDFKSDLKKVEGGKVVFATDNSSNDIAGNDSTIFLVNSADAGKLESNPKITVYKGINNMPTLNDSVAIVGHVYKDGSVAKYVYIVKASTGSYENEGGEYIYIPAKDGSTTEFNYTEVPKTDDVQKHVSATAIVDGVTKEIKLKAIDGTNGVVDSSHTVVANTLYKVDTKDNDGVITKMTAESGSTTGISYADGVMYTGNTGYRVDGNTKIYYINEDGGVSEWTASSIVEDETDTVYVVGKDGDLATVVYVIQVVKDTLKITGYTYQVDSDEAVTKDSQDITVNNDAQTITLESGKTSHGGTVRFTDIVCADGAKYSVSGSGKVVQNGQAGSATASDKITVTVTSEKGTTKTVTFTFQAAES